MTFVKNHRTVFVAIFYLLVIVFLVGYVKKLDYEKVTSLHVNWLYILVALPFSILSRLFLPYIWIKLIDVYQHIRLKTDYWHLNYIYAKTWLGKYIPGNVAYIAGKLYFASERGIDKTVLGITAVLELTLQLLSALLLGVVFLAVSGSYSNFSVAYNVFFSVATIIGIILIIPPVFNKLLRFAYKTMRRKLLPERYFVKGRIIIKFLVLFAFVHSLSAIPIYFILKAFGQDINILQLLYVAGAFIFAGAIGALAVFVPSGLGVREGVIVIFLANVLPVEIALIIALALRIWSVALDVIYFLISYIILKFLTNNQK